MSTTAKGFGTCLACYAHGLMVQAADPVAGSACHRHLRRPDWTPPKRDEVARRNERQRQALEQRQERSERRRGPRRRLFSELSPAGKAICASHAASPRDWRVPETAWVRLRLLRSVLGVSTVADPKEVLATFLACEETTEWQRNRWWRTYAVVVALSRLMDWEQESVVQATAARVAEVATEILQGLATFGFAVEGRGCSAELAQLVISRRSAADAMAWMESAGLAACLLRGASAEALGAEHGRAGIWVLTAPAAPQDAAEAVWPADAEETFEEVLTWDDAPPGRVSPPPYVVGPRSRGAAQAPPENGSGRFRISSDSVSSATVEGQDAPLARREQRLTEVFAPSASLVTSESDQPETEYLVSDVHRHREIDPAWDRRVPRSDSARRKTAGLLRRRAHWTRLISVGRLASVLDMWFEAGYCAAAIDRALDWTPDGTRQRRGWSGVDNLAGVIASRLARWLDDTGRPLPAPIAPLAAGQVAPSRQRAATVPDRAADTDAAETERQAALAAREAQLQSQRAARRASDDVRRARLAEARAAIRPSRRSS